MNPADKSVLDVIATREPIEAAAIAEVLHRSPASIYQSLAALDAKQAAVMVRAESGTGCARREWMTA